jgi:tetratricopeptide (TPR) repeat protein
LTVWSVVQAGVWADDGTLGENAIAVNPRSHAQRANLGNWYEYRARLEGSEAMRDRAIRELRRSLEDQPDSVVTLENLASILILRGEIDEATRLLRRVVELSDQTVQGERDKVAVSYRMLGAVFTSRGRYAEAAEQYRAALRLEPGNKELEAELAAAERRAREAATRPGAATRGS